MKCQVNHRMTRAQYVFLWRKRIHESWINSFESRNFHLEISAQCFSLLPPIVKKDQRKKGLLKHNNSWDGCSFEARGLAFSVSSGVFFTIHRSLMPAVDEGKRAKFLCHGMRIRKMKNYTKRATFYDTKLSSLSEDPSLHSSVSSLSSSAVFRSFGCKILKNRRNPYIRDACVCHDSKGE